MLALKARYPDLKLKKTPASSPSAPFPIIVTATVPSPPQASHIDVDSVTLQATIITAKATDVGNIGISSDVSNGDGQPFQVELAIVSYELPLALRDAIARELNTIRLTAANDGTILHLGAVFDALARDYVHLLCLLPQCLERYEGVDAEGGTVRRVAILSDQTQVSIDVSVPIPTKAKATSSTNAPSPPSQPSKPSDATTRPKIALPRALDAELDTLKRKYNVAMLAESEASPSLEASTALENLENLTLQETEKKAQNSDPLSVALNFQVEVKPTDPEWRPPGSSFFLKCCIGNPATYPTLGSFAVSLLSSPELQPNGSSTGSGSSAFSSLSDQEIAVFNKIIEMEVAGASGRPGALRSVLRQCENRAGEMLHQVADVAMELEKRRAAAAAAQAAEGGASPTKPSRKDREESSHYHFFTESESSEGSSYDSEYSSGSEYSDSEEEREEEEGGREERPLSGDSGNGGSGPGDGKLIHNSLQLSLEKLELIDIDTLDILKLRLQVGCNRCQSKGEAELSTSSVSSGATASGSSSRGRYLHWEGKCSTCHVDWEMTVVPRIAHGNSEVLAVLRAEGCTPTDLLPSILAAQCTGCDNLAAFREAQVGRWNERNCGHCHRRMAFFIETASFLPIQRRGVGTDNGTEGSGYNGTTGTGSGTADRGSTSRTAVHDVLIIPGQPLPDKGVCRHYRHSYRWLRFPCCGRRYPCDLCHEEDTDGHEMKWAHRMVCGFCSIEQPLGERCSHCGKKLATSAARPSGRNTCFWEGGEGQRDKKRLNRNDPHKFRGSKNKTRSRKDQRVGQKGKEKAERAAEKSSGRK